MKELLLNLIRFDLEYLFIEPTDNIYLKFFRYLFVGGFAFIIDAGTLFILKSFSMHLLLATAIGFILGLIVNFFLSKRFVFTEEAIVKSKQSEFFFFGMIGLIGLGVTELLMYLFTEEAGIYYMLSKVFVTLIVLLWNFLARKLFLYRN